MVTGIISKTKSMTQTTEIYIYIYLSQNGISGDIYENGHDISESPQKWCWCRNSRTPSVLRVAQFVSEARNHRHSQHTIWLFNIAMGHL